LDAAGRAQFNGVMAQFAHPACVEVDAFRDAIGRFLTGVTIVTTQLDGEDFGTTASAVTSLSLEPPMLLVCLNATSDTRNAILDRRTFAVSVLADHQQQLARRFADKGRGKFAGVEIARGPSGAPLVDGALASLDCRVSDTITGGTHTVFLAHVIEAWARDGAPLAYFRGGFGQLGGGA